MKLPIPVPQQFRTFPVQQFKTFPVQQFRTFPVPQQFRTFPVQQFRTFPVQQQFRTFPVESSSLKQSGYESCGMKELDLYFVKVLAVIA